MVLPKYRPASTGKQREPEIRRIFRTNLRNRRMELGLLQKGLHELLSQSWVQQLEAPRGREVPSLYQLALLAEALKCLPSDLLIAGRFTSGIDPDDDLRRHRRRR